MTDLPAASGWDMARLRQFECFARLTDPELEQASSLLEYASVPPDTLILAQDQPASSLYMLLEGRVALGIEARDARGITLEYLDAPAYFGVIGLDRGAVRATNAITCTAVEVLELPAERVKDMRRLSDDFILELLGVLAHGYGRAVADLGSNAFLSSTDRVVSALMALAAKAPRVEPQPRQCEPPSGDWRYVEGLTHASLAATACTSRETACRSLTQLAERGIVVALPSPPQYRKYHVDVAALSAEQERMPWTRLSESELPYRPRRGRHGARS